MMKSLLKITMVGALLMGMPMAIHANSAIEIIESELPQTIGISVSESILRVTGAGGQELYIYNVAGVRVMSIKVDGPDKRYELNLPKGCYIVKVGKIVRKISIR
ncbi:MAG: T9SS type A sorting domain-containing protein [Prevotella sp.]|nr:T9SS type A sorting domain-containing protein [Prevotella sp.]MBQ6209727.1 T9SS type A sorting domain-containing protein [Prevotella sp.]